eukprot:2024139-Prymnesium_polylepis.1
MKLSRRAPHDSVARSPVCSWRRPPPQCCRWRWHRSRKAKARDYVVRLGVVYREARHRWRGREG